VGHYIVLNGECSALECTGKEWGGMTGRSVLSYVAVQCRYLCNKKEMRFLRT
jgi:hypothetical protein